MTRSNCVLLVLLFAAPWLGAAEYHVQSGSPATNQGTEAEPFGTIQQAVEAAGEADYLGFGPVFSTATKRAAGSPRGLQELREVLASVSLPVVAIGGIQLADLPRVQACGAAHWAVISDILAHPDPKNRASEFAVPTPPRPL